MAHDVSEDEWSPQGPVTEIADAESWALLQTHSVGHLGLSVDDRPEIFPVNYAVDAATILFRTAAGTKFESLLANRFVAFEVDAEGDNGTWSVVIKGTARPLSEPEDIAAADLIAFPAWVPTAPYVYVRIAPETVRGRQFSHRLRVERR
ncbi:MAG TPA: pyridoxamine 5'-phosphate oxidase family protein [Galbitalea sp.]|jgi:nitroimidazol reductase NimA-like FMN-containing flavoprotein (pyridoxamine 5'-phosphate oxidase superfamily)